MTALATVRRGRPSSATLKRRREEGLFWIARQILRADNHAQRAAILLRVPDIVITGKADVLTEACEACGFADGAAFIAVRVAVASANRDERGYLPIALVAQLERWRRGMVAIARGAMP